MSSHTTPSVSVMPQAYPDSHTYSVGPVSGSIFLLQELVAD